MQNKLQIIDGAKEERNIGRMLGNKRVIPFVQKE
jgi:hypothetical protein